MRRPDGSILLLDFGSARITLSNQEQAFTVVVTPGYAPMEQYTANETQGPSTDLYAVGACLLFCLTGASPVDAMKRTIAIQSNEKDPLEAILTEISERDAGFSELVAVLRWLLQSQANLRPQSAGAALQRLGTSMVVPTLPTASTHEQQTIIFSPPSVLMPPVDLTVMRSIPSKLVEPMRVKLESMVGERATQILFQSIRTARNAQDLVEKIAEQIVYEPKREQAISSITQLLADAARVITVEATPVAQSARRETHSSTRPTQLLKDEETTQLLSNELAKYIGPIASMLLKKRLAKATSVQELLSQLEAEIPAENDRAAFRKAVLKLKIRTS